MTANEQLLLDITDVLKGNNISLETNTLLESVINKYHIKNIEVEATHPDLDEKIDLFINGKQLEGLSKITLKGYRLHLRIFAENVKKEVKIINTADIRTYLSKYKNQKMSTIATKLSVLKSFFGWLTSEEILLRDPTTRIKPPKKEKRLPKALSIEELELLRESCGDYRKRTLIELLYATGCRLSEIQNINRNDIKYETQSFRVIGKGNKEREVYLSFKAIYHLKKYLLGRKDSEPALIITERQPYRRLSKRGIQREIDIIASSANIHKKISPHTLRHTFATLTLNNGADLVAVQELLGHENPATTQIYAQITPERKRDQHKKYLIQ